MLNFAIVLGMIISSLMVTVILFKRKLIVKSYLESFYIMSYFNICYLAYALDHNMLFTFQSLGMILLMIVVYFIAYDYGKYSYTLYGEHGNHVDDLIIYYLKKNHTKYKIVDNSYVLYYYDEILKIEINKLTTCTNINLDTNSKSTKRLDALAKDISLYCARTRPCYSLKHKLLYSSFLLVFVVITVVSAIQVNNGII